MIYKFDLISGRLIKRICLISIAAAVESVALAAGEPAAKKLVTPNWYATNTDLFNAGKYQIVVKNLESIKFQGLQEARRKFLLGRTYAILKRFTDAAKLSSEAFLLDPSMLAAKFNQACYLTLAGDIESAVKTLEELESAAQTRTERERITAGQGIKSDPDLNALRTNPQYAKLVENMAEKMISSTLKVVHFEGCALKDKDGKIVKIKNFDCQGFTGAKFYGPADSCSGNWVKINESVPAHMTQNLDVCIYEL